MKVCTKCEVEKSFEEFPKEAKRKDGHYPWCKPCLSAHRKARYITKPKKYIILNKQCSKCKIDKPREEFHSYDGGNLHYRCITCEDKEAALDLQNLTECSSCNKVKPLDEFYKSRIEKTSKQCIECHKAYHLSPSLYDRRRNAALIQRFGISLDQYKELLVKQEYTCPVCLKPFEEGKLGYPVDHAHKGLNAGRIRAILHDRCNRFVMSDHTDPEMLRRAADLIENPLTPWMVPPDWVKPKRRRKKRVKQLK